MPKNSASCSTCWPSPPVDRPTACQTTAYRHFQVIFRAFQAIGDDFATHRASVEAALARADATAIARAFGDACAHDFAEHDRARAWFA